MEDSERKTKNFTDRDLESLIRRFDNPELTISDAYGDGGVNGVWPRFQRAAIGQVGSNENSEKREAIGKATLSRYAIWANTVRDNIAAGLRAIESGQNDEAKELLIRAANSLSAFSELQSHFDPLMNDD
jgi:hypothetical protein